MGISRIWVNRQGEKDDPSLADAVLGGLDQLPSMLDRLLRAP
jgi:hypothetical protein